jgi:3-hydroxybutyryl-CoA dehydrogenase
MSEPIIEAIENFGLSKRERNRTLFSRIGVVGCGKEGSSIATIAALNGMEVVFLEPNEECIANAYTRIEGKLDRKIQNWGLTESEKKAIIARIHGTTHYEDHTGERRLTQRKEVFLQLEKVLSPNAIIASNVSTVIVTDLASELEYQDRCIGLHFLSNVPDSNIIEVVRGLNTSDETFEKISQFARFINHQYVSVMESSGLVSVRMFLIQLNEACSILMEGIASIEDIDRVLTVGFGHRQGVFRTADQFGIEKIVRLLDNLYEEYGLMKYKPSPVLLRLYRAKHFGISRRKGFYNYDESGNIIK